MYSTSSAGSQHVWSIDESYLSAHYKSSWNRTSLSSKALTSEHVARLGIGRSRLDEQLDTEMYLIAHERRFASAQIYERNAAIKLPLQEKYLKLLGLALQSQIRALHKDPPLPQWTCGQLAAHTSHFEDDSAGVSIVDTLSIASSSPPTSPRTTAVAAYTSRSQPPRLKPLDGPDQLSLPPVEPLIISPPCPNVDSRDSSYFDSTERSADIISIDSVSSISSSDMITATNSGLEYAINDNVRNTIPRASDFSPVISTSSAMIMARIGASSNLRANGDLLLSPPPISIADGRARVNRQKRRRIQESKGDQDKTRKDLCRDVGGIIVPPKPGHESEPVMPATKDHLRLPPLKQYYRSGEQGFEKSSTSLSKYHISNNFGSGYFDHTDHSQDTNPDDSLSRRTSTPDAHFVVPLENCQQHSARADHQELSFEVRAELTLGRPSQSHGIGSSLPSSLDDRERSNIQESQEWPPLHQSHKRVRFDGR